MDHAQAWLERKVKQPARDSSKFLFLLKSVEHHTAPATLILSIKEVIVPRTFPLETKKDVLNVSITFFLEKPEEEGQLNIARASLLVAEGKVQCD